MLTKHYFDEKGKHKGSCQVGGIPKKEGWVEIHNAISQYPWPIKLLEGVPVQDTDKQPFKGEWYPKKEAKALIAARDKKS